MEFKREKSQNIYLLNKYHALIQYDIEFIVKVGNLLIAPFLSVQIYSIFFALFLSIHLMHFELSIFTINIQLSRCNW